MLLQLINIAGLGILFTLTIVSVKISYERARERNITSDEWLGDWISDFSTEMAGALLTAILFGLIVGIVQQTQNEQDLRDELISQVGSHVNSVAVRAFEELKAQNWLDNDTIRRIDFSKSNLSGTDLEGFDTSVMFSSVPVISNSKYTNSDADWVSTYNGDYTRPVLSNTNLRRANLSNLRLNADMSGAYLAGADLSGSELLNTDLRGANLVNANLKDAIIDKRFPPKMDEKTVLPDGTNWSSNTDFKNYGVLTREFPSIEMIQVPAACFSIGNAGTFYFNVDGSPPLEIHGNNICVNDPLWISKYEVNQAEFKAGVK